MTEFWYVYKEYGGGPRYKHGSIETAINEAKRLSTQSGGTYYVLRAEAVVETEPLVQFLYSGVTIEPPSGSNSDDDIPF